MESVDSDDHDGESALVQEAAQGRIQKKKGSVREQTIKVGGQETVPNNDSTSEGSKMQREQLQRNTGRNTMDQKSRAPLPTSETTSQPTQATARMIGADEDNTDILNQLVSEGGTGPTIPFKQDEWAQQQTVKGSQLRETEVKQIGGEEIRRDGQLARLLTVEQEVRDNRHGLRQLETLVGLQDERMTRTTARLDRIEEAVQAILANQLRLNNIEKTVEQLKKGEIASKGEVGPTNQRTGLEMKLALLEIEITAYRDYHIRLERELMVLRHFVATEATRPTGAVLSYPNQSVTNAASRRQASEALEQQLAVGGNTIATRHDHQEVEERQSRREASNTAADDSNIHKRKDQTHRVRTDEDHEK